MKKYIIYIGLIFIISSIFFVLIYKIKDAISPEVQASSNSGTTSDVQLLARAINGEARGEPYEGQVAVRSCNSK